MAVFASFSLNKTITGMVAGFYFALLVCFCGGLCIPFVCISAYLLSYSTNPSVDDLPQFTIACLGRRWGMYTGTIFMTGVWS